MSEKGKSYGQRKRESYDYRTHYIKHNPGLFNSVYFCSQCLKVLNREEMEVDHIFPVSKFLAPNRVINCVAICSSCNKKKSDKMGKYSVKGLIAKIFEEIYVYSQRLIILIFKGVYATILLICSSISNTILNSKAWIKKSTLAVIFLLIVEGVFM